jgi:hypothetical protein
MACRAAWVQYVGEGEKGSAEAAARLVDLRGLLVSARLVVIHHRWLVLMVHRNRPDCHTRHMVDGAVHHWSLPDLHIVHARNPSTCLHLG